MTDPVIRPAQKDALLALLDLYRHLHPDDPVLDITAVEAVWSAVLASGLTTPIVAEIARLLVSSCTLTVVPNVTRGARPYAVIEDVVTHPDYRRAGLGVAVLQAALSVAWKANCYKVTLATGSRQDATLRFYQRAGFVTGGKTYFEIRQP